MSRALYAALYGALAAAALAAAPFSRKIRRGLFARFGSGARYRLWGKRLRGGLWFHVASAGELEQALPVLDAVRAAAPDRKLFLSYFSPSAESAVRREEERRRLMGTPPPWDGTDYSPWDFPSSARHAVSALAPSDLVLIHRELWPGLVGAAKKAGTRLHLIAASWNAPRPSPALKRLLEGFSLVGTTREDSAVRLSGVAREVTALGDPRIDRVLARRSWARDSRWKAALALSPVFVGASLWDEDVEALGPLLDEILLRHPEWRCVLVPHEPTPARTATLTDLFSSRGKTARLWSDWSRQPESDRAHLVVDGVGWLAELYGACELVFVGGSFRKKVHSVLEPAAYGRPVLTGPYFTNSAEAVEMAEGKVGLRTAADGESLRSAALEWLESPEKRAQAGKWMASYLEERRGSAARYATKILSTQR